MKIDIIKNEKDVLEFYIEGERHTLPNLLKEKIALNNEIDFVAYKLDHPLEKKARFIIRAKNPKKILEQAIKELQTDISEFQKAFDKIK